jgi:hypothetical protein
MRTLNAKQKEGEMYLELVCDYFDIPVSKVISKSRKVPYPECRQLASYFITKYTKLSLSDTALIVGYTSHASAWLDKSNVPELIKLNPLFKRKIRTLLKKARELHKNLSQKAVVAPPVENEFFDFYSDVVFEQTARGIFSDQLKPAA